MPKTKVQKRQIIAELADKINRSKSVIFTDFKGLGAKDGEVLRKELKKENGEYMVVKKTLLDIAFRDLKSCEINFKSMTGNMAAVFGYMDEVMPAKLVEKFRKGKEDKINFLGGVLEGKFIGAGEVSALASLPSKQELYAQIVGSMNAPISGFVNALAGNIRNFVGVLNAIKEKK